MAGDWLKMRVGLRRHPKVVHIVSALKADRLRVVGALHAVWSVFDEHSVDGILPGYSFEMMDEEIGFPGFSAAMHGINWLDRDGDCGLVMPEFSKHNGASAKRRAQESDRKKGEREAVRKVSASDTDEKRTREEKRRGSSSLRSEEGARAPVKSGKGTTMPPEFSITEAMRKWAGKKGYLPFLELHFEHFVNYAKAGDRATGKPILARDWDAKFRTSVSADWGAIRRNAQRGFKPGTKPPNGAPVLGEPWYITWTGIKNEGLRRGIEREPDEGDAEFTDRVFKAAGVTRDQAARDRTEWRGAAG